MSLLDLTAVELSKEIKAGKVTAVEAMQAVLDKINEREDALNCYVTIDKEKALDEAGDKLDANDKAAVEADLNALKDLLSQTANAEEMTDSQVADIKAAQEKMMESAQKLFAKMYEQTQQAGGQAGPDMSNMGGAGNTNAGSSNDDDVVDADYKEV